MWMIPKHYSSLLVIRTVPTELQCNTAHTLDGTGKGLWYPMARMEPQTGNNLHGHVGSQVSNAWEPGKGMLLSINKRHTPTDGGNTVSTQEPHTTWKGKLKGQHDSIYTKFSKRQNQKGRKWSVVARGFKWPAMTDWERTAVDAGEVVTVFSVLIGVVVPELWDFSKFIELYTNTGKLLWIRHANKTNDEATSRSLAGVRALGVVDSTPSDILFFERLKWNRWWALQLRLLLLTRREWSHWVCSGTAWDRGLGGEELTVDFLLIVLVGLGCHNRLP